MASNRVIIVKTFERAEGALCVARELVIVFMIRIATVMHHDTRGRPSPPPHPSGGEGGSIIIRQHTAFICLIITISLGILLKRTRDRGTNETTCSLIITPLSQDGPCKRCYSQGGWRRVVGYPRSNRDELEIVESGSFVVVVRPTDCSVF